MSNKQARGSDGGRGSGSAAEQDSYETGHLEVKVSWSESLAGVFVALEMGFVGTVLSVHLPGGFPGRLSSLKAWSFCSFSFPAQSCVLGQVSSGGIFALIYAVENRHGVYTHVSQ